MLDLNTNPCALMPRKKRRSRLTKRPYIRVTVREQKEEEEGGNGKENTLPSPFPASTSTQTFCAFDRLFVAEQSAMRVSYFELQIDDGPVYKQKNSGIEFSVHPTPNQPKVDSAQLTDILDLIQSLGFDIQAPKQEDGQKESVRSVEELCDRLGSMQREAEGEKKSGLSYRLKEPVFNHTFKMIQDRGRAKQIWLRSKCTNGQLFVDRGRCVPFGFGSEILIEYCSDVSV